MRNNSARNWQAFAMGPHLRAHLQANGAFQEDGGETPTADEFSEFLLTFFLRHPIISDEKFISVLEELVMMRLAKAAIAIAEQYDRGHLEKHVHPLILLGSAHMLENQLEPAEKYFRLAHSLKPEELPPYINLVQIFFQQHRDDECWQWCLATLKIAPNAPKIWSTLSELAAVKFPDTAGEKILALAKQFNSWLGSSLASQFIAPEDPHYKADLLGSFYHHGVRDEDFLCEYTGALGVSTQYEKIPAILWAAENVHLKSQSKLPWRLCVHGAQAFLGLNDFVQAQNYATKALQDPTLPSEAKNYLFTMLKEINDQP